MIRMLHLNLVMACFLTLLTAFTLFTVCSSQALAEPPQGPTQPLPDPGTPTDAGGGPAAVALFLVGAASLTALQRRRSSQSTARG
jgi:hypothetical protein